MSLNSDFADEIAREMRSRDVPYTWRKVTTILSAYQRYKLTQEARRQIEADLDHAGLACVPSMLTVDRAARVRLSLRERAGVVESPPGLDGSLPAGVTLWEEQQGRWRSAPSRSTASSLLVVDIDLSVVADHAEVIASLPGRLDGLDQETLEDLVTPDSHAKFKKMSAKNRRASVYVVTSDPEEAVSSDKAIPLTLKMIEFAIGPDWLVVARHPSQLYVSGSAGESSRDAQTVDDYMASLHDCGLDKASSSQEAALAIITHSLDSFTQTRAGLASYLESWRTEYAAGSLDKTVLVELQATLPLVVDALEPLLHPSVSAWVKDTWVTDAVPLNDQMRRNLDALHSLQGTTAAAIAQADQAQNEKYQRSLATLAAVFLAPALVASVFGANQLLEDSPQDLLWLLFVMVATGVVTQLTISRVLRPRTTPQSAPTTVNPTAARQGLRSRRRVSPRGTPGRDVLPTPSPAATVPPLR